MKIPILAWLFAALVLEECPRCVPGTACEPHATAEIRALEDARPALASKDERERADAVSRLGKLNAARANAPSRAVTEALAKALGDPSSEVRLAAAMKLATPQHADVAVPALVRALERERPKIVDPEFDANDHMADLARKLDPKAPKKPEAVQRRERAVAMSRFLCSFLVDALARYPDDRAVAAVEKHLRFVQDKTLDASFGATRCVEALFRLGARSGIDAAVAALEREERVVGSKAKPRKSLRVSLAAALASGAAQRGHADAPPEKGTAAEWRSWFGKHREEFPAKLGAAAPPSTPK